MSDLDDILAKRLDDEGSFPNRGKNWKQMTKRLDAYDAGTVQGNRHGLRLWQAATLIALGIAGYLLWKNGAMQKENKVLHQEVAHLQTERSSLQGQLAGVGMSAQNMESMEASNPLWKSQAAKGSNPVKNQALFAPGTDLERNSFLRQPEPQALGSASQSNSKDLLTSELATQAELLKSTTTPIEAPDLSDSSSVAAVELPATEIPSDTLHRTTEKKDAPWVEASPEKDTIAALVGPTAPPPIKPNAVSENRFRIGAQATLGFAQPKQTGVSAIRGQGILAEARILRSIWVSASAEWLHHEVATKELVRRFHPPRDSFPKPPETGGPLPPPPPKLVLVESAPRYMVLGLGIRYELPIKFWLRPSVRIAHEWKRISPTLVTYKFEKMPNGPAPRHEYTAEKYETQWLSNQWRFGIGLEKDLQNWTFGLWADYSKDFSVATPSFDALYLRAGVQYTL